MALLKGCNKYGCNKLISQGQKYCDVHRTDDDINKSERNKYYDTHRRDAKSTAFYKSKEWARLRETVKLKANGLCLQCLNEHRIKAGYIADHIIPLKIDWSLRLVESNLQYLCKPCHNRKTHEDKIMYKL